MRQTITPCLIQKKSDHFSVKFTEYPNCELKCSNLEDCLDVAPVFLSSYLLSIEEEFKPHTRPLTPKTDNKDQIFTLIKCDMDEMENVLIDFKVTALEFVEWLSGRAEAPEVPAEAEPEKDINKPGTSVVSEPEQQITTPEPQKVIDTTPPASDVGDEFDTLFNGSSDTSSETSISQTVPASIASSATEEKKEETQLTPQNKPNRGDFRQRRNNRGHSEQQQPTAPTKDDKKDKTDPASSPVSEPVKTKKTNEVPQPEEKEEDKESDGLKGKVKDMNYQKHNNAGVFGVIEEEELEFVSKPNNKPQEKTPASTPNRHQQKFNKKNNKHYPNKKKKGNFNNNEQNNNDNQPS